MKIYVVSELNDVYDNENCDVCWKVVKAFMRQEDAKKYVEWHWSIPSFEPQNAGGTLSMGILAILILVFGLLSYHYLGLHNRWISEGDSK